jgi:hypothetical protein
MSAQPQVKTADKVKRYPEYRSALGLATPQYLTVPLELQPWAGERGARRKDALELRLHNLVCRDGMSLNDAQACIAEDWYTCASKYLEP